MEKKKKVWQTPTVDLLAKGYVDGGAREPNDHEVSNTHAGRFFIAADANPGVHHAVPQAVYNEYNHS